MKTSILNRSNTRKSGLLLLFLVSLFSLKAQTVITIAPTTPSVTNCIPFGNNTSYGFTGFIYRNIPAFTLNPGDKIKFDLGALNSTAVRRNIYFSAANINPLPYAGVSQGVTAVSWIQVVTDAQIPLNPNGNNIVGDFELTFTATASFTFAGGGFLIGFGASPPGMYVDGGCEQVGVSTTTTDPSGFFYERFLGQPHLSLGVLDQPGSNFTGALQGFQLVIAAPPIAKCKNHTAYLDNTGNVMITPSMVDNGSSAPAGLASLVVSPNSFDCSDIGANLVSLIITDINGISDTCFATVKVLDTIPPVAVCQNLTVYLNPAGNASITAAQVDAGSTDNCGISSRAIDKTNFTCANVGANLVKLKVADASGNASECTAIVTVIDTVPPTAVCKNISVTLVAGTASINPSDVDGGSSDACGISSISVAPNSFDCSDIGPNVVTLTVTDNNGNVSSCNATVTVIGAIPAVSITQGVLPGLCQGGAVVLTANAPTAISYLWSEGSVTNPINVYSSGTYSVVVTNSYGCTNSASTNVVYDASELLSSYTILANNATLNTNSKVLNGGLGSKANFGSANVLFGSQVTSPGTFVKAPFINTFFGSATTKIYAKADVPLPAFKNNPYGSGANLYVPSNTTVTIHDSIFRYITIGWNAKVTFTSKNIYARRITMSTNSKMEFTKTCPIICVNGNVSLGGNCKVNTVNDKQVCFFITGNLSINSGSTFKASAYMQGNLSSNGSFFGTNKLTGMFIASYVSSYRTDFDWDPTCEDCAGKSGVEIAEIAMEEPAIEEDNFMTIFPNPSNGIFNVRINSEDLGTVNITIASLTGQVILQTEKENTSGSAEFTFDLTDYSNGIYFLTAQVGGESLTSKIIINK